MFANTQFGGADTGFPDVCLTPAPPAPAPVPVPYPNMAAGPTAVGAVYNILVQAGPVHTLASAIPQTNGDNAGISLGVASGMVMGPSRHITAAFTVIMGGMPATRVTSMSVQNGTNCPGARISPSQVKLLLLAP